jgi:cytochrome c peroxidase
VNGGRRLATWGGVVPALLLGLGLTPAVSRGDGPAAAPAKGRTLRLPATPYNYAQPDLPAHFKTPEVRRLDNAPRDNPVTDAGAALGRALFYDPRLSVNNTVSCASCHQQKYAFASPNRFSKGYDGRETDRNAPSLVNARYRPGRAFFWDGRAASLEDQALKPIANKVEMGQDLDRLTELLRKDSAYPELFKQAFDDPTITKQRVARALAQFVRSLVSCRSKYDEGAAKATSIRDDFSNFTADENRGKRLFAARCANCHLPGGQTAVFAMNRPRNSGIDPGTRVPDLGVADVTFNAADAGKFVAPDLRNIEFTAPYMHDGRLKTLEEVAEFYSTGVKDHPNLDGFMRGPGRQRMTDREKAALVAFLKTLSDPEFLTDPRFADPFREE